MSEEKKDVYIKIKPASLKPSTFELFVGPLQWGFILSRALLCFCFTMASLPWTSNPLKSNCCSKSQNLISLLGQISRQLNWTQLLIDQKLRLNFLFFFY